MARRADHQYADGVDCKNCGRDAKAPKRRCWACYQWLRLKGVERPAQPINWQPSQNASLREVFEARVIRSDGCWPWRGHLNNYGYGVLYFRKRRLAAHRISFELLVGPIPPGQELDHLCRNRACVRPDHLEVVTRLENILRGHGLGAQNARKSHCRKGHPFDEENTRRYVNHNGQPARACRMCERAAWRLRAARHRAKKRAVA